VALLELQGLSVRFGGHLAVSDVDLDAEAGQITGLIGPNGAGKTTTFNLITGIDPPDAGDVWFADTRVTGYAPHRLAAIGMGRTFQNIRLFRHLNALENVMIGRTARTRSGVFDALAWTRRCSIGLASATTDSACRRNCRTATSVASKSPARWHSTRSC